jgi:ubiquinone/menaquinone biosynthesis C-methylase UbiE
MKKQLISNKLQIKNQKQYFSKEFRTIQKYKIVPWQRTYVERIKSNLLDEDYKNKKLIDIGSGSGYVAIEMAKMGIKVTACDITKESLRFIERYKKILSLKNLDLINCSADKIPLRNNSVNYVVANAILEHLVYEKKAIKEWKRILKPKGKMFLTVPIKYKYLWPFFWPLNYIHDKRIGHLRRYDLETIKEKFGMKIEKVYYSGHLIKMIGLLISIFYKNNKLDALLERTDSKFNNIPWGASNIIVVLRK